ncbi:hypothetical protein MA03_01340 [Infirmifilum uzonense]|uniref:ECF transporter S component n=2 Tax=Infirmifilum uzonense TaxID=1550241 RepID=A0A0F7FGG0_9CREN|nr:hypothetical protein MA03_01340 [Infirmifilum uzonense]
MNSLEQDLKKHKYWIFVQDLEMKSKELSLVAIFVSLSIALRVLKNLATTVQFVNIPLAFALLASTLYGPHVGFLVGFLSYFLSDLLIFPGIWTLINSILAGFTAFLYPHFIYDRKDKVVFFISTFLSIFLFDIFSSVVLYILFGVRLQEAILVSIVGLFLPVMGGYLIGVGPLTEFVTAFLVVALYEGLKRRKI